MAVKGNRTGHGSKGTERRFISRRVKALLVAVVVAAAAFLLYRTLSRYEYQEVVSSIAAIPRYRLFTAGAFAAASYLCLTGFDFLALRYVGHPLPYRRVALASFVSLSLGHNIGLAALSSGAIRYRFYSRSGLGADEIAKIILFCGITVGLGLITLAGVALGLRPDLAVRVTGLERPIVLALAVSCLAVPVVYVGLAATVRRPLRFRRWTMGMPSVGLALAQVTIGCLNFTLVAGCLHQALSGAASLNYLAVASVYVLANVATIVTHVPGGLGVIESVVLLLLPQSQLLGAVLVFRFIYFLIPLAIGSILFAMTELRLRLRDASQRTPGG